jgi:hypothetical protein
MMAIMWLNVRGVIPGDAVNVARPIVLVGTMVMADCATHYYKRRGCINTSTMRGNPYPLYVSPTFARAYNLFYSASQVIGTVHILSTRNMGPLFMMLVPIQTAPFCMTLVKKGIINQAGWHMYYTAALLLNYVYPIIASGAANAIPVVTYWKAVAFVVVGRFALRINKYLLWALVITRCMAIYFPCQFSADASASICQGSDHVYS